MNRHDGSTTRPEVTFLVEGAAEGGLTARALGESIFTEASDLQDLHARIRDAVHCHFDEGKVPTVIRLQFIGADV
ncbi:MAG: 2-oxoisovalerate dehydrogenase [Anaerolineales bacterium]